MSQPRRALVVIDVQNEYIDGALRIEYPDVDCSLSNIARAIDAARVAAVPVIVVQHSSPSGSAAFAMNTRGWELHDLVRARSWDHYIEKLSPSAFVGTDLAVWLNQRQIDVLTVAGYMTHNCCDATIKHGIQEGFSVEFLVDASGSLSYCNSAGSASAEDLHRAFSVVMQSRFAAVANTDQWIAALAAGITLPRDTIYSSHRRASRQPPLRLASGSVQPPSRLRRLKAADVARISHWPTYPDEFSDIDYALRKNGWLKEFQDQPGVHCFVAEESASPVAMTILANTAAAESEFRIALRADKIGSGLGMALASETLSLGFGELGLSRIHLVVRTNNLRAIRLYERLGFASRGACRKTFNGKSVELLVMDLPRGHR